MPRDPCILVLTLFLVCLQVSRGGSTNPPAVSLGPAPSLQQLEGSEKRDLGLWDDVFALPDDDFLVLRRDKELFRLSIRTASQLRTASRLTHLFTAPEVRNSQIISGIQAEGALWLFFESSGERAPFALEVTKGIRLDFEVPGMEIPPDRPPGIQSWVIAPHVGAALVMISGGEKHHWPRPENRPIYFWIGLSLRKVVQVPVGWDLEYFSADQKIAVFAKPQEKTFQSRPLAALHMETGSLGVSVPDRQKSNWVAFTWTNKDQVKPLLAPRRPETGALDRFVGVSMDGLALPLQVCFLEPYIPTIRTLDGWLAFHLRGHGSPRSEDDSLWFSPLRQNEKPIRLAKQVRCYEVLGKGKCVFGVTGTDAKRDSHEALVYDAARGETWNVLEGIQRLPELDPRLANKSYIEDKMTVQLVRGFGQSTRERLVLVLFSHFRGDMRAAIIGNQGSSLARQLWRKTVLLTSEGKRYETNVLQDEGFPDLIWLHGSGKIFTGTYKWCGSQSGRIRQVQLNEVELKLSKG